MIWKIRKMKNNHNLSANDKLKLNVILNKIISNDCPNQIMVVNSKIENLEYFALKISQYLVCEFKKEDCDCVNCLRILQNTYYDCKRIGNFVDTIKKEMIKDVVEDFSYSSLEKQGVKIYIIQGVELMTQEAANSILKFLEEPPQNTYAILLSQKISKVLKTITSRCLVINLENQYDNIISEDNSYELAQELYKNMQLKKFEQNFLVLQKIKKLDKAEAINVFSNLAQLAKRNYQNEPKLNLILEICYEIEELLTYNINYDLVLEKAIIAINEGVRD